MSAQRKKTSVARYRTFSRLFSRDVFLAFLLLCGVIFISIVFGLLLSESQLGSWGTWLGAFIASIALVASSYAIILQARQGESSSWNIALTRLGELYDQAAREEELALFIWQSTDLEGKVVLDPDDLNLSPCNGMWLASLFLAYEQIYVASNALAEESRRAWHRYLKNQLNKPLIRAAFIKDAMEAQDYHYDFWQFIRGHEDSHSKTGYRDFAIHPGYFVTDGSQTSKNTPLALVAKPFFPADAAFWLSLYQDADVRKQMYAMPTDSNDKLIESLCVPPRKVFTVFQDETQIGGFTITPEKDSIATFGFIIAPALRGKGYAKKIVLLIEKEARAMGILTLRADIYSDNFPSIRSLSNAGFRKFIWMEKNIDTV